MISHLLASIALAAAFIHVQGFSITNHNHPVRHHGGGGVVLSSTFHINTIPTTRGAMTTTRLYSSNKEDEIAALEEKLRLLKEEAAKEEEVAAIQEEMADVVAMRDEPYAEMLSEQWKETEQEEESGAGGVLTTLIGALVAIVFLIGFSQVPVGQEDYSRYSVTPGAGNKIDLGDLNPVVTKVE